ncbi:hypothetical protein F8M41_023610 [Gigaspora margarita]|uniref:Uncharacterized protein n=1 Tax=Gigaspora margarita TaxID=4874 RepID=A0A8H4AD48_GIGMA|nr:hypothetical protein F8M41_023610 [Gigaspora margarita]
MNSISKHSKLLMKEIPVVTFLPSEYEIYCERFASMQNKNSGELFQKDLPLCRQNSFVHQTLKELYKNEQDQKILRAASDYCDKQRELKNRATTINNVYIKNEVECSSAPEKRELNKNESTEATDCPRNNLSETACPRNNLLRKISFFIMIFIIIGLFLYVIKNVKEIKELEIKNQKKQDKYDKLSFEFKKMIERLKTENDEYRKLKNIKEKIDRDDDSDSFC